MGILDFKESRDNIKEYIKISFPFIVTFYHFYILLKLKFSIFFRKIFFKKNREETPIIISLATYPSANRHNTVYLVIESLLLQSVKPKKIFLWLYEGEFPNKLEDLPKKLINLQGDIFKICWSKKDIKSYNKIMNTLEEYSNEVIVTVDDDIIYQKDWLEGLWDSYKENPKAVQVHRASKFYKKSEKWESKGGKGSFYKEPSFLNNLTGIAGVLYPPNCFYKDVLREDIYTALAPTNDDLWLWAMVSLNGIRVKRIEKCIFPLNIIPSTQIVSLFHKNDFGEKLYWVQFDKLIKYYPEFERKLEKEWENYNSSFH